MGKSSGIKGKLETYSYQMTSKKGTMPVMLKSINELSKTLERLDNKKKKPK